jgi:hypothetical protein
MSTCRRATRPAACTTCPLVGDVGRDHGDAKPLLHRCERGQVARHDGHLGALVDQGFDEPEAQASAAAGHHDGHVLDVHRPAPVFVSAEPRTFGAAEKSHRKPARRRAILAGLTSLISLISLISDPRRGREGPVIAGFGLIGARGFFDCFGGSVPVTRPAETQPHRCPRPA